MENLYIGSAGCNSNCMSADQVKLSIKKKTGSINGSDRNDGYTFDPDSSLALP